MRNGQGEALPKGVELRLRKNEVQRKEVKLETRPVLPEPRYSLASRACALRQSPKKGLRNVRIIAFGPDCTSGRKSVGLG
jgi:hypothetical protein